MCLHLDYEHNSIRYSLPFISHVLRVWEMRRFILPLILDLTILDGTQSVLFNFRRLRQPEVPEKSKTKSEISRPKLDTLPIIPPLRILRIPIAWIDLSTEGMPRKNLIELLLDKGILVGKMKSTWIEIVLTTTIYLFLEILNKVYYVLYILSGFPVPGSKVHFEIKAMITTSISFQNSDLKIS